MKPRKESASDQLRRMLSIIPWIVARNGVSIEEAANHFGLTSKQLTKDLGVVFMVGVPPYSPDALVDVVIDDGRVWITYADFFSRPLKLTPGQGLGLLAASEALLSLPGAEPDGPLSKAMGKLSGSLGVVQGEAVDIALGTSGHSYMAELNRAIGERRQAEVEYYSHGRDALTERTIEPGRVFATGGAWYVEAYCTLAQGTRLFRLDRIASLVVGNVSIPRPYDESLVGREASATPTCRLRLSATDQWVIGTYGANLISSEADGGTIVDLPIYARPWLERLLLRISVESELLSSPGFGDPETVRSGAAQRILRRYEG